MTTAAAVSTPAAANHPVRSALMLGALGVVFGDIGTSPIYAFREALKAAGDTVGEATILGVLSLVFWTLTVVVSVKYVSLIMRADNGGEGGLMALLALASQSVKEHPRRRGVLLMVGVFGVAILYYCLQELVRQPFDSLFLPGHTQGA